MYNYKWTWNEENKKINKLNLDYIKKMRKNRQKNI